MNAIIEPLKDSLDRERHASIARGCDLSASTVSRFAAGKGGLSLEAAERLARYMGLILVRQHQWAQLQALWQAYREGRLVPAKASETRKSGQNDTRAA